MAPLQTEQIGWGYYIQNPNTNDVLFAGMTQQDAWEFLKQQDWYVPGEVYRFGQMLLYTFNETDENFLG